MKSFEVVNRTLTHNGTSYPIGSTLELPEGDGAALAGMGRVRPARVAKPKTTPKPKAKRAAKPKAPKAETQA